jgi:hypothetical protein
MTATERQEKREYLVARIAKCDARLAEPIPFGGPYWRENDRVFMGIISFRDKLQQELTQLDAEG